MCNHTSDLHGQVEATHRNSESFVNDTNQLRMDSMEFQTEAKDLLDKVIESIRYFWVLVIERLVVQFSNRAFRRCVLNVNFHGGQAIFPRWWPSLTKDVQIEPQKGCPLSCVFVVEVRRCLVCTKEQELFGFGCFCLFWFVWVTDCIFQQKELWQWH